MARLPTVGGDDENWGTVLNTYLSVEHASDGTHSKPIRAPGFTFVIAANNASTSTKLAADYVCTGTADNTKIQAAIDALPASNGCIMLTEGTYNIAATITIAKNITILGAGMDITNIQANSGLNDWIFTITAGTARFLHFGFMTIHHDASNQNAGGGIYAVGAVQSLFEHIHFDEPYSAGLYLGPIDGSTFGHHNRVMNCLFDHGNLSAGDGRGIYMTSSDENMMINCDFETMGGSGSNPYGIQDAAGINHIIGCVFINGKTGIRMESASGTRIIGCMFDGVGRNGIDLNGSRCSIIGNTFDGIGSETANTYSAINITFAGTYNTFVGNMLRSHATAGQTRSLFREQGSGGSK